MARKKRKTSIALEPDLIERLDRVAAASKESRSELITQLVVAGLDQAELLIKATTDPVLMGAIGRVMADPGVLRNMVSGLRSELTDGQLELFRSRIEQMEDLARRGNLALPGVVKKPRKRKGKR